MKKSELVEKIDAFAKENKIRVGRIEIIDRGSCWEIQTLFATTEKVE